MKSLLERKETWQRGIRHWGSLFLPLGVITQEQGREEEEEDEEEGGESLLHSFVRRTLLLLQSSSPHDVTQLKGGCLRALPVLPLGFIRTLLVIIGQCKSTVAFVGKCKCSKFLADCSSRC